MCQWVLRKTGNAKEGEGRCRPSSNNECNLPQALAQPPYRHPATSNLYRADLLALECTRAGPGPGGEWVGGELPMALNWRSVCCDAWSTS